ncbi:NAD(P)-binding domain-containing protein [Streptomyces sp. B1866]|uniref:NAD(P)-dependent oxidoreductase n=1 Tax=Streptomyces sp. B1866 TaxID=3075431 RepID=UPI00288F8013|nr:NAD(P)-binding domain-containing protein [Streptomyces sp. B1866]MDT3398970.1 NAD(P)-binding domain-containing protein [Streptomyces sp. B1866]
MNAPSTPNTPAPTPDPARTPVTVIGLGLMGRALAAALLDAGHPTTVWNRTPAAADLLVARGATLADTPAAAARASGTVVVCLATYEVMFDVLDSAALGGRTLVNLVSGTPDDAREAAAWAAERGAEYLDGAIMAVPQMIGSPEAQLFYGGPKDVFEEQEPVLRRFGGGTVHLGSDPGIALVYDLALLTLMYAALLGLRHAQTLARAAGVTATDLQPYLSSWIAHLILPLTGPEDAAAVDSGEHATDVATLSANALAVGHITRASRQSGVPVGWLTALRAQLDQAIADGHGADGFSRLIDYARTVPGDGEAGEPDA